MYKDLTGQTVGDIKVLEQLKHKKTGGRRWWRCLCSCGSIFEAPTNKLTRKGRQNCGCKTGGHKDLTGRRFGVQTVLGRAMQRSTSGKILWQCRCDCGKLISRSTYELKSGKMKSCGCMLKGPRENLVGQRFGRLVVESFSNKNSYNGYIWSCLCDCGNYTEVPHSTLKRGESKSCGCYRLEQLRRKLTLPPGEAALNIVYRRYMRVARKKGRLFQLSKEEFRELTQKECGYCGNLPATVQDLHGRPGNEYVYNGLDRVDNEGGYTISNVVTCCSICNYMKGAMSYKPFIAHISKIHIKAMEVDQCKVA